MTWWLHTRRVALLMGVTAGFWAVVLAVGDSGVALPQLGGATSVSVPLVLFTPLAPAIALNACCGSPTSVESTAVRRAAALDALLAAGIVALTAAAVLPFIAGWLTGLDGSTAEAALRNLACYTGLALLGRTVLGDHASTVLPTLAALAVSVFGYGRDQSAHWWAWPAAETSDTLSWTGSAALLVIGLHRIARRDFPRRS
ncbi:hypothetical protein [Streptomyces tagetis]|uniref:Uncharacterized protein n=1 Tax=Streptomyces tagetis TaxID=2820809 RepID=A0A941B345_9ACTN|nr:hypothetical protein [Streptomyces sp. RG38]MBQ0827817.1 hypothetical protein [Streptomyces sp. RG38]